MLSIVQKLKNNNSLRIISRELYRLEVKVRCIRKPILFICQKFWGLKIVTREELLTKKEVYRTQIFGSEEIIKLSKPLTIGNIPKEIEEKFFLKKALKKGFCIFEQPFVCEINHAELVGPTAVGFDESKRVILGTTTPQFYSTKNKLEKSITTRSLISTRLPKNGANQLEIACSLVSDWSKNYWHWLADTLTRLEGLEYYRERTGREPTLIIDSQPTAWQLDSLKLLGYEPDKCIRWNGSRMQVRQLIVPSFRRHTVEKKFHGLISPAACRWVSRRIVSNLPHPIGNLPDYSPNIFISRQKALGRRILNEQEVIAALAPLGFVAYTLEEMSFQEQVRLFSQASSVVAPHGAGLANMIFAQNLKIIELFGSFIQPSFFYLAKGLGFWYGCLMGRSPSREIRQNDGNIVIDISQLKELVMMMQEQESAEFSR